MTNINTNIVYFTTTCNLACTYCYQHVKDYPHRSTTFDELKKIASDVIEREPVNQQTLFVLFGGEPTVRWEHVKFFMDLAYKLKKNVSFNMITNGIRFLEDDFLRDFLSNVHYREGRLQLEISFDGSSHERVYSGGKDAYNDILSSIFLLKEIGTPFRIRYTIGKHNIKFLREDIKKIIKNISPERIILSENEEDLSKKELNDLQSIKKELISSIYNKDIVIPICMKNNESCSACGVCEILTQDFSIYLKDTINNKKHLEAGEFNDFILEE